MKLTPDELQKLFRYGYSLTADESDAYDLLHGAIERTMARGAEPEHPVRYVMRAMRNAHLDRVRRERRAPHVELEEGMMDVSEQVLENEAIATVDLERIWGTLEIEERELLHLWAVEEYTAREIAEQTQTSRNTILSRIHRLRLRLRARFAPEEAS